MDRVIQPFAGQPGAAPARTAATATAPAPAGGLSPHAAAAATLPPKTAADFVRALRRRAWLALAVAIALIVPGALYVVRLPAIYKASAQIVIEPPSFDERVASLLQNATVGRSSRDVAERYVPNRVVQLRNRGLAERAVASPTLGLPLDDGSDPAQEILDGLQYRQFPQTTLFDVTLENRDPERAAKLLEAMLTAFARQAQEESTDTIRRSTIVAQNSIKDQEKELLALDEKIGELLRKTPIFAPGGKSILDERYVSLNTLLSQKRVRYDEMLLEDRMTQLYPHLRQPPASGPMDQMLAQLREEQEYWTEQGTQLKRIARNYDDDPAARHVSRQLQAVMDKIDRLERSRPRQSSPTELSRRMLAHSADEVRKLEREAASVLEEMRATMPEHQKYLGLWRARESKERSIAVLREHLGEFEIIKETQREPVLILQHPTAPLLPVRPKRSLYLVMVVLLGLGAGAGLVCLLEFLDQRVKVPEHLSNGLTLPLLGVIPRMRRLAAIHRGGHLWTPGAPRSLAADAYRNLRASLLGLGGPRGPIVTLLVTSAKAGEGKSTTALNLAATCARAGERTLLMDVDLRRSSLGDVFRDEPSTAELGLVDALRGDMPWQRAVVRTDIPNLDYLPVGDPTGIPIEILGTLELRQLVKALSGHYHRVILDGPAVLGLADCRMLGRVVDAALLVVRCGAHGLSPLQRAKLMLEQSRVTIAGVVFNSLDDDLSNWSSYVPLPDSDEAPGGFALGQGSPLDEEPAGAGIGARGDR